MAALLEVGETDVSQLSLPLEFALEPHRRSGLPSYVFKKMLEYGIDLSSIRHEVRPNLASWER